MPEYIEREALLEKISRMIDYCEKDKSVNGLTALFQVCDAIIDCKAADVVEVRHGRWETMHYEGGILDGTNFDKCSVCGYKRIFEDEKLKTAFTYCPNCGAKMNLE